MSAVSASLPVVASVTWCPSAPRASEITQRMDRSSSATRMREEAFSDMIGTSFHGERHGKDRADVELALHPQDPAVLRDDPLADRETKPGPVALGGEEG